MASNTRVTVSYWGPIRKLKVAQQVKTRAIFSVLYEIESVYPKGLASLSGSDDRWTVRSWSGENVPESAAQDSCWELLGAGWARSVALVIDDEGLCTAVHVCGSNDDDDDSGYSLTTQITYISYKSHESKDIPNRAKKTYPAYSLG